MSPEELEHAECRSIIFTDLDGTLIDFETYSPAISAPYVQRLVEDGVPLVFCSSKTLAEQRALMEEMEIATPCIVENGSGIFLPEAFHILEGEPSRELSGGDRIVALGVAATEIQNHVREVSREFGIDLRPYSSMTVEEVAEVTGLSEEAAARARKRDFSETLTASLSEAEWIEIGAAFEAVGLRCLCGGRFYTVTSRDCNKGKALVKIVESYKSEYGINWQSVGIGDSANDYDMLKVVNKAYLVQQLDGDWKKMDLPNLKKISGIGPKGWILAVEDALGSLPY